MNTTIDHTTEDNIVLFTLPDCIYCVTMKTNLAKMGIKYTEVNNVDVITMKGIKLVPALEINGRLLQHHEAVDWVDEKMEDKLGTPKPLLTKTFLSKYPDHPAHMTNIGLFTFYRTYSRFLPELRRRETWKETVARAVSYNVGLERAHRQKNRLPVNERALRKEAQDLFDAVFNLKMFISGRTLFIGGTPVSKKYPMSNFNCSFTNIEKWSDLPEIFYLLMLGSGMGFKCTKEMAAKLPPIRTNVNLILSPYQPVPEDYRLESTDLRSLENGFAKIYVGDSKEGWRDALHMYLKILTEPQYEGVHTVKVSFNSVRPRGERLKIFGGTASGPEPLMQMFDGFDKILKNQIDPSLAPIVPDEKGYGKVRPIHILDMENMISTSVVSGNVRRSASLYLFEADDYESLFAKYGINGFWTDGHFAQHDKVKQQMIDMGIDVPAWFDAFDKRQNIARPNLDHRRMSNNSIAFTGKPSDEFLHLVFTMMQMDGEPGFINIEAGRKRRENMEGINP